MKKDLNRIGVIILIIIFFLFYIITSYFLERRNLSRVITNTEEPVTIENNNQEKEKNIVNNLYQSSRILYDVVNNKFRVSQDDTIVIGDIIYKKILNFDEVMNNIFTENGTKKYLEDLKNYFAYTDNGYYLAGNLISYQTYYFRGDNTNIFILSSTDTMIEAIIYEKWTSSNKNTLAKINIINKDNRWLIDKIDILSTD